MKGEEFKLILKSTLVFVAFLMCKISLPSKDFQNYHPIMISKSLIMIYITPIINMKFRQKGDASSAVFQVCYLLIPSPIN